MISPRPQPFSISNELLESNARFDEEHGHNEILKKSDFPEDHHIDARMTSNESLLAKHCHFTLSSTNKSSSPDITPSPAKTYPMMIKMIQGSIQDVNKWKKILYI